MAIDVATQDQCQEVIDQIGALIPPISRVDAQEEAARLAYGVVESRTHRRQLDVEANPDAIPKDFTATVYLHPEHYTTHTAYPNYGFWTPGLHRNNRNVKQYAQLETYSPGSWHEREWNVLEDVDRGMHIIFKDRRHWAQMVKRGVEAGHIALVGVDMADVERADVPNRWGGWSTKEQQYYWQDRAAVLTVIGADALLRHVGKIQEAVVQQQ